jgi:hypothetical protein
VRELAQQGRFKEAEALLAPQDAPPEDTTALHALAAVVTQAGDFSRALGLWRRLLQREPGHAEARDMIATIETWTSRPAWFRFLPLGAGAAAVLLVSGVWWASTRSAPAPQAPNPVAGSPLIQPAPVPTASPAGAPARAARTVAPAPLPAAAASKSEPPPLKIQVLPPPPKTKKN